MCPVFDIYRRVRQHKMDIVLDIYDRLILTPYVYPKQGWAETDILRQLISLTILINIHGFVLYFALASFSYFFLFDRQQMNRPSFLKVSEINA